MRLRALLAFMRVYPLRFMLSMDRELTRYYRVAFVTALLAQPFARRLAQGPMTLEEIAASLSLPPEDDILPIWLDFGVSVKALRRSGQSYAARRGLPRRLLAANDTWQSFFRLRGEVWPPYILKTPAMLARGERFQLDDAHGELYAHSSRTLEPLLLDVARNTACDAPGPCVLLEVGCGSGIYIKAACEANAEIFAVGIETQPSTAKLAQENIKAWGLEDRARIEQTDVRDYHVEARHDVATLHNMIYYFPLDERAGLLRHVRTLLKPGGRVMLTSLCRANNASLLSMDLWSSMNGGGPLPTLEQLERMLAEAGFVNVRTSELMPFFWCVTAQAA